MELWLIVVIILAALAALLLLVNFGDIRRYLRMRKM